MATICIWRVVFPRISMNWWKSLLIEYGSGCILRADKDSQLILVDFRCKRCKLLFSYVLTSIPLCSQEQTHPISAVLGATYVSLCPNPKGKAARVPSTNERTTGKTGCCCLLWKKNLPKVPSTRVKTLFVKQSWSTSVVWNHYFEITWYFKVRRHLSIYKYAALRSQCPLKMQQMEVVRRDHDCQAALLLSLVFLHLLREEVIPIVHLIDQRTVRRKIPWACRHHWRWSTTLLNLNFLPMEAELWVLMVWTFAKQRCCFLTGSKWYNILPKRANFPQKLSILHALHILNYPNSDASIKASTRAYSAYVLRCFSWS